MLGALVWQRFLHLGVLATAGACAAALGISLAFLASLFEDASPIAMVAIPLTPLVAVALIANPLIGPLLVVVTLPAGSVGASIGAATVQISEGAVLAIGALIVIRRLALGHKPLPWARQLIWPLLLLAWMLVALHSAADEALAVKQFVSLLGGILLATVVLASCRDLHSVRILLGAFTLVGLVVAVTALSAGRQFEASYGGAQIQDRLQGAFESPNQLGSWCALAIPVAAGLVFASPSRPLRFFAGCSLLALLGALMFSLSRSAWIGTGVAMLMLLVTLREARRLLVAVAIPVIVAGYFIFSFAPAPPEVEIVGERFRSIAVRSPYDNRSEIYDEALREIRDDPLTGQGPGGFSIASRRAGTGTSTVAADHAHNLLLNWTAESGVPAGLLILAFTLALASTASRASRAAARLNSRDRGLILGIAAALLAVFVQGFFDYTLGNPVIHITVWMLIGALLVFAREAERLERTPVRDAV